jgi:hypothetical protein
VREREKREDRIKREVCERERREEKERIYIYACGRV